MVARWRYSREPCGMFGPNDMNFGPILPKMYGMICEGQEIWQTNAGRAAYRSSGPHMFLFHTSLFTVVIIQIPYSWCWKRLDPQKIFYRHSKWPYLSFSAFLVMLTLKYFMRTYVEIVGFTIHIFNKTD